MRRRRVYILLGFMGIGIFGLLVTVIVADGPPPDDRDLRPRPARVVSENGYPIYQAATAALVTEGAGRRYPHRSHACEKLAAGDLSVLGLLLDNQRAIELFHQALEAPVLQVPEVVDHSSPIPGLLDAAYLATLEELRAMIMVGEGRVDDAFVECRHILELGRAFQGENAALITSMIGCSLESRALHRIRKVVSAGRPSLSTLQSWLNELRDLRIRDDEIEQIICREYAVMARLIEKNGRDPARWGGFGNAWTPILFKPNRTLGLLAEHHRWAIADVPRPLAEMQQAPLSRSWRARSRWRRFLGANYFGEELVSTAVPFFGGYYDVRFQERGTELYLALAIYERRTGGLPETLDELVPELIPAVPRDPFDGARLRYSREDRVVWCVGRNLLDEGASEEKMYLIDLDFGKE